MIQRSYFLNKISNSFLFRKTFCGDPVRRAQQVVPALVSLFFFREPYRLDARLSLGSYSGLQETLQIRPS